MMKKKSEIKSLLFDLDDTLTEVDDSFMEGILATCLSHFSVKPINEVSVAKSLRWYNHNSSYLSTLLSDYIKPSDIESFWDMATALYEDTVDESVLHITEGGLKLLAELHRRKIPYGIISNTHASTGYKTLSVVQKKYDLALFDRALFLNQGHFRKPHIGAYTLYCDTFNHVYDAVETAYIGNTIGDVQFAVNTQMIPLFIGRSESLKCVSLTFEQSDILAEARHVTNLEDVIVFLRA